MIRVIRAEWRKLRRPTLFLGTVGAALFFTGLFTSLLFILIDSPRGNSDPENPVSREMLASVLAVLSLDFQPWEASLG